MTRSLTAPALLACLASLLAACNTTDAMTPLVDIGDSSMPPRSSPVTQREVERMAGSQSRQAFAAEPQEGYHPAYNQAYRPGPGAPPTTMQAQADAMSARPQAYRAPEAVESEPLSNAEAEEQDMGDQAPPPHRQQQQPQQQEAQQVAAIDPVESGSTRGNTVRFLPIIGAPVQAVTPLSRQLGSEARSAGEAVGRRAAAPRIGTGAMRALLESQEQRRVRPEPLELIEVSFGRGHDMHDHRPVVDEQPVRVG